MVEKKPRRNKTEMEGKANYCVQNVKITGKHILYCKDRKVGDVLLDRFTFSYPTACCYKHEGTSLPEYFPTLAGLILRVQAKDQNICIVSCCCQRSLMMNQGLSSAR